MTGPSDWPLPPEGVRFMVPRFLLQRLAEHPLADGLYPRAMGYYPEALGHRVERQEHADHLLLYCAGGRGMLRVNRRQYPVARGDLMMLPAGLLHAYASSSRDPWTMYWVHFDGSDVDAFWEQMHFLPDRPVRHIGAAPKVVSDFETLLEVRSNGFREGYFVHAANHLRQMLSMFALMISTHLRTSTGDGFDLQGIHTLMQEKLHGQLDLATLAEAAGMSRHGFCRRYKAQTGHSPYQHFLHLKMERACYLLDISDQPVAEIGAALGYDDAYYFSRLFRKVMGMSPTQYRVARHG